MNVRDRKTVFRGMVIEIEQMEVEIGLKGRHIFQVIRHPGGAGVLPVHADGSVSLIRQLRPAVGKVLLEIPAGRLDDGEPPIECARRELLEETGLRTERMIPLGLIHSSPGVFDEIIHLYAALEISEGTAEPEADEDIEVVRFKYDAVLDMVADGRISDAKTVAAIFRWQLIQSRQECCNA
jgi:ADP-ribose pyrophosphatase